MRLGQNWLRDPPKDMRAFFPPPRINTLETRDMSFAMRKEFLVIAAVIAVALAGYLAWRSAQQGPTIEAAAPPAAAPQPAAPAATPAPATTAPAAAPAPAATPAPATPPAQ
jgi:hypothetical protein